MLMWVAFIVSNIIFLCLMNWLAFNDIIQRFFFHTYYITSCINKIILISIYMDNATLFKSPKDIKKKYESKIKKIFKHLI